MTATWGEKPVKQWLGMYQGVVINNADPSQGQNVQVQVPQVFGTAFSTWASPVIPIGEVGPPVGTMVVVAFLGGDPDKPVYFNQTGTATDWTVPSLVVGDPVYQTGTLAVYGENSTYPASTFTGGIEVDNMSVTGELAANTAQFINPVIATEPGTASTPETWHTMFGIPGGIGSNGWTIVSGGYHASFRMNAQGDVELSGRIYASGSAATAGNICTLPSGYYQTTSPFLTAAVAVVGNDGNALTTGASPRLALSNVGVISISGVGTGPFNGAGPGTATTLSFDGVVFPVSAG